MKQPSVLLAEDDPTVLKMTKLRLEHEGLTVIVATDGREALDKIMANGAIDLVLLDIKMPKLDGFQICKVMKGNPATDKIPIIVFTGSASSWQKITDECIELGITDWLKKPFRSDELMEKVHHVLDDTGERHGR